MSWWGHGLGALLAFAACRQDPTLAVGVIAIGLGDGPLRNPGGDVEAVLGALVRDTDSTVADALRRVLEAQTPESRDHTQLVADQLLPGPWLEDITVPVLIIAGDDDPLVMVDEAAALAVRLPRATGARVPTARHLVMADAPGAVNLLIAAFLARVEIDSGFE